MATNETDGPQKPQRKKRTGSKFLLLALTSLPADPGMTVEKPAYIVEAEGNSVKSLRAVAASPKVSVGEFKIVCIRDSFSVREKQLKLIER